MLNPCAHLNLHPIHDDLKWDLSYERSWIGASSPVWQSEAGKGLRADWQSPWGSLGSAQLSLKAALLIWYFLYLSLPLPLSSPKSTPGDSIHTTRVRGRVRLRKEFLEALAGPAEAINQGSFLIPEGSDPASCLHSSQVARPVENLVSFLEMAQCSLSMRETKTG